MKYLVFVLFIYVFSNASAQQAWTQKKGASYLQVGVSSLNYNHLHNYFNDPIDIPRKISETTWAQYGEYGLLDKLTVSWEVPYKIIKSGAVSSAYNIGAEVPNQGQTSALGNVDLALTYKWLDKNSRVVSAKLISKFNTARFDTLTALRTGFNAFGMSPSILAGFGNDKLFTSGEVGYQLLTKGYLGRLFVNAQIGWYLIPSHRLMFILGWNSSSSIGDPNYKTTLNKQLNSQYNGLFNVSQTYYSLNLKFGIEFKENWFVWTSMAGGVGYNIGVNALYSVAIGYKLSK